MLPFKTTGVSYDAGDPTEVWAHELREKLKKTKNLPVLSPSEDREDAAQNVLTRVADEAQKRGTDMLTLVQTEPQIIQKKLEAERSRVRRQRQKLAKRMSEEMADALPVDMVLSETESAELIEQLTQAAGLTAKEGHYIRLCSDCGIIDYDLFCELMCVDKDQIYRIAYKARNKLEAVLPITESLLERYEHPSQPSPDEGGTWKRFSGRVV